MSKLTDLRERKANLAKEIRQLADKMNADGYTPSAEDEANWSRVNSDYNQASSMLEREEIAYDAEQRTQREEDEEKRFFKKKGREDRKAVTEETRAVAMGAWFRHQLGQTLSDDEIEACRELGFRPDARELIIGTPDSATSARMREAIRNVHPSMHRQALDAIEMRTLSTWTGSSGGYLKAPEQLVRNLEVNMLAFGGMRQVSDSITTTSGERIAWPTADDTSNKGALLGESASIGSSVDPSFTQIFWDAYKFSSKPILVPYELLEDSVFNLPSIIGEMFGERLGRITNDYYTTGTGASQPKGAVTASSLGVTAASATAITADELVDMTHAIDPAYRNNLRWMMHDNILLYLRKLKQGTGEYLWVPGLSAGVPDRLLNYPITINQSMQSSIATATKTILYGDFNKYKIRRVNGMRMYRLQERYRDTDQDAFVAFIREDGNLLEAGTPPIVHLLQA